MKTRTLILITIFLFVASVSFGGKEDRREYWPTKQWRTSTPEKQGMDSDQLRQISKYNPRELSSVLIARNGYLVLEEYYSGDENDLRILWSATKSVISALVGIALKEGYIKSIDQKMVAFFPEYVTEENDLLLKEITLRHLLTMTAGFGPDLLGTSVKKAFSLPILSKPGEEPAYNSSASNLLSGVISKSTGMNALEFGKKHLFGPLGISNLLWSQDPQGYSHGGSGLRLSSRDMAKIGYLYLNNGTWDSIQILPGEWVQESTRKQSESPMKNYDPLARQDYGYQWWVTSADGHSAFYALGTGGQFIFVIPSLDIVLVMTSRIWSLTMKNKKIVSRFVIPAVRE